MKSIFGNLIVLLIFLSAHAVSAGVVKSAPANVTVRSASGGVPPISDITGGSESTQALSFPNPTINNISIEWRPEALNYPEAKIIYRKVGSPNWFEGFPLKAVKAGGTNNAAAPSNGCTTNNFCWSERYSGSLFNLEANTNYEIKAYLVNASNNQPVYFKSGTVKTRALPMASTGGLITNVSNSSQLTTALSNVNPGAIILLAPGNYSGITVNRSGTLANPITIRGQAGVIVNGNVSLMNISHVIFERMTVNGSIRLDNSNNVAVINNIVNSGTTRGIGSGGTSNEYDNYIADNIVTGAAAWIAGNMAVSGGIEYEGIQLTGPGHVIQNNRVSGYRDCISFYEASEAKNQWSIDIANNDLSVCVDDAIEADSCYHNCRVTQNRITNTFIGISTQPSLGGPTYIIRNAQYNVLAVPFKLHNDTTGDIILNNTVVKNGDGFAVYDDTVKIKHAYFRNNLIIGSSTCTSLTNSAGASFGTCGGSTSAALSLPTFDLTTSSSNYQAYGQINTTTFRGRLSNLTFTSYSGTGGMTNSLQGNESQSLQINSLSLFQNTVNLPGTSIARETAPDLRIKNTSSIFGAALKLPNINNHVTQPSIGAYEYGDSLPTYGPRN